jgi:hypothetical protein
MLNIFANIQLSALFIFLGTMLSSCDKNTNSGCHLKEPAVTYILTQDSVFIIPIKASLGYEVWTCTAPNFFGDYFIGEALAFSKSEAVYGYIKGSVLTKQFDCQSKATPFSIKVIGVPTNLAVPCTLTAERLQDTYIQSAFYSIQSSKSMTLIDPLTNTYKMSISTTKRNYFIYLRSAVSGSYNSNYDYTYNSDAAHYSKLGVGDFMMGDANGNLVLQASYSSLFSSRVNGSKTEFVMCRYATNSDDICFKVVF